MDARTTILFSGWRIDGLPCYIVWVLLLSLILRLAISLGSAKEIHDRQTADSQKQSYWTCFLVAIKGVGSRDVEDNDYWYPTILGWVELASFPILMFVGYWSFIGAWLGFKALPQWSRWRQKRTPFNRFLIGNALVLIASMILAKAFIVDP